MQRDPLVYLDDIVAAGRKIERYTAGLTFEQFQLDEKTIDAVVLNRPSWSHAGNRVETSRRDA